MSGPQPSWSPPRATPLIVVGLRHSAGPERGLLQASAGVVKRRTETPERAAAALAADLFDRRTPLIGVQLASPHRTTLLD